MCIRDRYRFSAELDFNGKMIADKHLSTINARTLARRFYKTQNSHDKADITAFSNVLSEYGSMLVRAVGSEVDRIEADIQEIVPGVMYVDLEADRGRFWWYRASMDSDSDCDGRNDTQVPLDAAGWQKEAMNINLLLSESDDSESAGSGGSGNDSESSDENGSGSGSDNGNDSNARRTNGAASGNGVAQKQEQGPEKTDVDQSVHAHGGGPAVQHEGDDKSANREWNESEPVRQQSGPQNRHVDSSTYFSREASSRR